MKEIKINTTSFKLPFLDSVKKLEVEIPKDDNSISEEPQEDDDYNDDEEEINSEELLLEKQNLLPTEAIFLGSIDSEEEENWNSWVNKAEYYILPLTEGDYDWAIFHIRWDDNWGRWEWSADARISGGIQDFKIAARLVLSRLWQDWDIDLKDPDNSPYQQILDELKSSSAE
jgi:hypothetical protein